MNCRTGDWWLLGMVLLYTGVRRGEALALDWSDIDRKAGVIHITKKLSYAHNTPVLEHFLKSKNGKRDIPLFADLEAVLPTGHVGKIFHVNGEYLTAYMVQKFWKVYCMDADLMEERDGEMVPAVTPHQFRHSFATLCYEAQIKDRTAASWLGDTKEVLSNVYQELRSEKALQDRQRMEQFLADKKQA